MFRYNCVMPPAPAGKPKRSILSSTGVVALIILCIFLPYRWLWVPCAFAVSTFVLSPQLSRRELLKKHSTLLLGVTIILLLQAALDPLWWAPWIAFACIALWLRPMIAGHRVHARATVALIWVAAALLLWRPSLPSFA